MPPPPDARSGPAAGPADPSPTSDELLAREMRGAVKALLDAVPMSRKVLQALAAVEKALAADGLEGIDWLPQAVLEKACQQLKSLPLPPDNKVLPQLLTLMGLAVATRLARHNPTMLTDDRNEFLSSFLSEDKLQVSEGSHSEFVELSLNALTWPKPGA